MMLNKAFDVCFGMIDYLVFRWNNIGMLIPEVSETNKSKPVKLEIPGVQLYFP